MGIEMSKEFCLGATGVAILTSLGVGIWAWLGRGKEYREIILRENCQGDESDLIAGRAMMVVFAPEEEKGFARKCAREVTEEYNEERGKK